MNEQELQQQIIALVQAAMSGDQLATQQIQQIMQAAQLGNQQAALIAQMIQQVAQQMQLQQAQMAKFGAKLNYIKSLRGICPEGFEMQYYKKGGQLCKKCMKKAQEGSKLSDNPIDKFKKELSEKKDSVASAKCGKKIKKNACGSKIKKVTKADDGTKVEKPTAQKAEERYNKGKVWGRLGQTGSNGITLTTVTSNDGGLYTPAMIQEKVMRNQYGIPTDTAYYEAPRYINPFVKVITRSARNTDSDRTEYETLKRRFNTAKSVAK